MQETHSYEEQISSLLVSARSGTPRTRSPSKSPAMLLNRNVPPSSNNSATLSLPPSLLMRSPPQALTPLLIFLLMRSSPHLSHRPSLLMRSPPHQPSLMPSPPHLSSPPSLLAPSPPHLPPSQYPLPCHPLSLISKGCVPLLSSDSTRTPTPSQCHTLRSLPLPYPFKQTIPPTPTNISNLTSHPNPRPL